MTQYDIIVCGGGAAGFFTAINIAERDPSLKIAILERGKNVLEKVRISGGGRCNVMHSCYDPRDLVKFYPRGEKELRSPFHTFSATETQEWFENHGVTLKTEDDGRMFPDTDSSQTIIDCFLNAAQSNKIDIITGAGVQEIYRGEMWKLDTHQGQFSCNQLVIATGSNTKIWEMLKALGHTIIAPVPSLFTFNIKDPRIKELPGISSFATVKVVGSKLEASGPLLITHWGMSGPAILRLSAWGARILAEKNYRFQICVNWMNDLTVEETQDLLIGLKQEHPKRIAGGKSPIEMPNRLWDHLVEAAGIPSGKKWADLSKTEIRNLATELSAGIYDVNGKSTFKEEFVTAGGIDLREVDFKTMESKVCPNLFFAGEILNIDAITGGFNFQNAWTTGWIVSQSIARE